MSLYCGCYPFAATANQDELTNHNPSARAKLGPAATKIDADCMTPIGGSF